VAKETPVTQPDPRACRIQLGQAVLELVCHDEAFATSMRRYFGQGAITADPTVSLTMHLVTHETNPTVPTSLLLDKQADGASFDLADGLVTGRLDPASGRGELHVKTILTNGRMTRVFEQVLYQLFHTAARILAYDAVLVHSAGVVADGRGFLFVGASEAGKSTVADLSQAHAVVNDEMNLIEFTPDGPWLRPSPFNGHYPEKRAATAPLTAILLLDKGAEHGVSAVGSARAAAAIAAQVAAPVALEEAPTPAASRAMMEQAIRLVSTVPTRQLTFRRDDGFWPVLLAEFANNE
jgi:hypothetical protein